MERSPGCVGVYIPISTDHIFWHSMLSFSFPAESPAQISALFFLPYITFLREPGVRGCPLKKRTPPCASRNLCYTSSLLVKELPNIIGSIVLGCSNSWSLFSGTHLRDGRDDGDGLLRTAPPPQTSSRSSHIVTHQCQLDPSAFVLSGICIPDPVFPAEHSCLYVELHAECIRFKICPYKLCKLC